MNREEGFFTEWKLGNTPNKKPGTPAFGGGFLCLCRLQSSLCWPVVAISSCYGGDTYPGLLAIRQSVAMD
ncbi:hypothetical protein [Synechococcus sp. WH 8020]|uniref:hypothetical protein n=1 Tax=Synechococcus sp. (strain WH8020) TaxID=32052 RepID=UPI000A6E5B55|nr:hypothetical protein [Synechococcus sp. WH 8020]